MDRKEGEDILINLRSILRMRIEKNEISCSEVKFEAKSQTNYLIPSCATKLMANSAYSDKISKTGLEAQ